MLGLITPVTPKTLDSVSAWLLFIPLGVLIVTSLSLIYPYYKFVEKFDYWLSQGRRRRRFFRGLVLYIFPPIVSLILGMVGLSDLSEGNIGSYDIVYLSVASTLSVLWIYGQVAESWHLDRWDERLEDEMQNVAATNAKKEIILRQRNTLVIMSNLVRTIVGLKSDRVRKALNGRAGNTFNRDEIKAVLAPNMQVAALVTNIHDYFRKSLPVDYSLRVAYFKLNDGCLQLVHRWDGASQNCISSPLDTHADKFQMDRLDDDCFACWVARTGRTIFIADTDAADRDGDKHFRFFDDRQREQIKSILGFPLIRGDERPYEHVITVDTNRGAFFDDSNPEQAEDVKRLAELVGQRLLFETDMQILLS